MNDHTRKMIRLGLGSSPMFDSVEIVRDGKIVKSIPADSAQIGCYPSCQGTGHDPECPNIKCLHGFMSISCNICKLQRYRAEDAEALSALMQPNPTLDPPKRNPQIVSGAIRQRAEWILSRTSDQYHKDCLNITDAHRILELLDELDAALLQSQLRGSIKEKL